MLKGLSTVTTVGSETVDGVATTHYKVSVDTSKLGSKLGLDPSPARRERAAEDGHVRRLAGRRLPAGQADVATASSASTLHFSKWGEPVHVVAPPASQVEQRRPLTAAWVRLRS